MGLLTDPALKKAWPGKSPDPAMAEILIGLFPATHFKGVKLKELELTREEKRDRVFRSLIFLESNLEYEWPAEKGFVTWSSLAVLALILGIIGLGLYFKTGRHIHFVIVAGIWFWGLLVKKRIRERKAQGDYEVWPFRSRRDYDQERERIDLIKGFGQSEYWDQIGA